MRIDVSFKENEHGDKFPYIDLGYETHGRISFRLWVSGRMVEKDEDGYYLEFPMKGKIERTEKGNLVLRPSDDYVVYFVFEPCGYRGSSSIKILSPETEAFWFSEYSSPRGSLGVSLGALINAKGSLKYRWEKTGRLYGSSPEGVTTITPDGKVF